MVAWLSVVLGFIPSKYKNVFVSQLPREGPVCPSLCVGPIILSQALTLSALGLP